MPSSGVQTCARSEEHTSELQSHDNLVCRLLLEKKDENTQLSTRTAPLGGAARPTFGVARGGDAAVWVLSVPAQCRLCRLGWGFFFFFLNEGAPPITYLFPPPAPFPS